jgi:hypothetical protein
MKLFKGSRLTLEAFYQADACRRAPPAGHDGYDLETGHLQLLVFAGNGMAYNPSESRSEDNVACPVVAGCL